MCLEKTPWLRFPVLFHYGAWSLEQWFLCLIVSLIPKQSIPESLILIPPPFGRVGEQSIVLGVLVIFEIPRKSQLRALGL